MILCSGFNLQFLSCALEHLKKYLFILCIPSFVNCLFMVILKIVGKHIIYHLKCRVHVVLIIKYMNYMYLHVSSHVLTINFMNEGY